MSMHRRIEPLPAVAWQRLPHTKIVRGLRTLATGAALTDAAQRTEGRKAVFRFTPYPPAGLHRMGDPLCDLGLRPPSETVGRCAIAEVLDSCVPLGIFAALQPARLKTGRARIESGSN